MEQRIVELLEQKDYVSLRKELQVTNSADLAAYMEELSKEHLIVVFRLLAKEQAVDTFSYMMPEEQEKLICAMTDQELGEVISELFWDDTIDLIEEMPASIVKRILSQTDAKQRRLINEFLNYPEDSAGSLMTIEFVDLKSNMTVEDAFARIRRTGVDKETIYTCYVLNERRLLQGIVTVRDLLLADGKDKIADLMETNLIVANTLEDKEEVAKKFLKYDLNALPVVDKEQRLVGIITIDDAVDVMQEENTEDFERMAAMAPSEESYFRTSVSGHARNRIMWLLFLMLSASVTGSIITKYEKAFSTIPLLVAFIPMLTGTGGNCGSQSSTLVIRGMAMDEIRPKDIWRVIFKEIRVAALVGVCLALVNAVRICIQYASNPDKYILALVIGLALIGTVILAKLLGCMLPIIAKKLHLDPAIMAAPLISTMVDTCSILIYFNIAMAIMKL